MAVYERTKDFISAPFSASIITERQRAGWQMISIEWRRELPASEMPSEVNSDQIPYGLRISDDCKRLEVDPYENAVMLQMMDLLVQDFSYARIVSDLNERGLRMRNGAPWDRVSVFQMMPRLIEAGPRLFADDRWRELQKHSSPGDPGNRY
ncbi:recombinase family protein [Silvibacterium acidisoli]|uniref:recombinase family protein n=1 Tax=Acidobacteriaceae bacterium ZG23-2 TaxID=2883246 RepID=UPI00406BE962